MKRFKRKVDGINVHLDISKDSFKGLEKPAACYDGDKVQPYLEMLVLGLIRNCLGRNPELRGFIDSLENIAILDAHTYSNEDPWTYAEKGLFGLKIRKVQDWINKYDNQYNLLMIACCNPDNKRKVKSMSSVLAYPAMKFCSSSTEFYGKDYLIISNPRP